MGTTNYIGTKVIFQDEDGLYPVEDKRITENDLNKLVSLMPETGWIIIQNPLGMKYNDKALADKLAEGLTTETIYKMAEEKPLDREAHDDIMQAFNSLKNDGTNI